MYRVLSLLLSPHSPNQLNTVPHSSPKHIMGSAMQYNKGNIAVASETAPGAYPLLSLHPAGILHKVIAAQAHHSTTQCSNRTQIWILQPLMISSDAALAASCMHLFVTAQHSIAQPSPSQPAEPARTLESHCRPAADVANCSVMNTTLSHHSIQVKQASKPASQQASKQDCSLTRATSGVTGGCSLMASFSTASMYGNCARSAKLGSRFLPNWSTSSTTFCWSIGFRDNSYKVYVNAMEVVS